MIRNTTTLSLGILAVAGTIALSGCSASGGDSAATASPQAASITMTDGWAKAVDAGDMGMSAVFGTLANGGSADANLVSASCPAVAGMVELHETYTDSSGASKMQEKQGGFVIPAGGSFELKPGGNHIMLMQMPGGIAAGEEVSCTLTFGDSSTQSITVPVKDFSGANESYNDSPSSTMNMG